MTRPNRRQFLAASMALGLAGAAPRRGPLGANDRVVLGFIGVGGMGSGLLDIFRRMPDVDVAAVCDLDPSRLDKAKAAAGGKVDAVEDYRRVLDRRDITAVVVATPDHWHSIPTILACQAGKDVYCEKPLACNIAEGRAMVRAADKYKRVTQMGNLIHAGENYHRVVEIVRSGVLGKVTKARVWMAGQKPRLGNPADGAPPEGVDYDRWLGPAPTRPFNPNRFHFNWRYYWDYAGGNLTDFCCHIVDPVHWAMQVDAPATITATGGRYGPKDNAETPDTLEVLYHYKEGFDLVWSQADTSKHGFEGKGLGIMFQGTEATLTADYSTHKLHAEGSAEPVEPPKTLPRSPGHHREWLDAIKTRAACSCNFEYGQRLSSVGHLGNIALKTGEVIAWDGAAERITNRPEANRLLAREIYRPGYAIPEV